MENHIFRFGKQITLTPMNLLTGPSVAGRPKASTSKTPQSWRPPWKRTGSLTNTTQTSTTLEGTTRRGRCLTDTTRSGSSRSRCLFVKVQSPIFFYTKDIIKRTFFCRNTGSRQRLYFFIFYVLLTLAFFV